MRLRTFLFIVFSLLLLCSQGQVKFLTLVSSQKLGKNEYLKVEYQVTNAKTLERFSAPVFKGFNIVSGPMEQKGMNVDNGNVTRYEGLVFILRPIRAGSFRIPGATAVVDGRPMHSEAVQVLVSNSKAPSNTGASINSLFGLPEQPEQNPEVSEQYYLKPGESMAARIKEGLQVRVDVNKTSCYEGEPIVATYKLCSHLHSESRVTRRPSLTGFSVYDMVQPEEGNNSTVEKINGKLYNVHILRKVQLYPLEPGSFELDPAEVENTVSFLRSGQDDGSGSLPGDFPGGKMEQQQVTLASAPVMIHVRPLPSEGKPASFDGAVGQFTLQASLSKNPLAAGETGQLLLELKGAGNLTLINAPVIHWPEGVDTFETRVRENIEKTVAPLQGSKTFEYSFSCRRPGILLLPAIEFSYFDPASGTYKKTTIDTLRLTVSEAAPLKAEQPKGVLPPAATANNAKGGSGFNWLLLVLGLLLAGGLFAFFLRHNPPAGTNRQTRRPVAPPEPAPARKDPFLPAVAAMQSGSSTLFYQTLGSIIWTELENRLALSGSRLNKGAVMAALRQRNFEAGAASRLELFLRDCEMALYTPVHSTADMQATLQQARELWQQLQGLA